MVVSRTCTFDVTTWVTTIIWVRPGSTRRAPSGAEREQRESEESKSKMAVKAIGQKAKEKRAGEEENAKERRISAVETLVSLSSVTRRISIQTGLWTVVWPTGSPRS